MSTPEETFRQHREALVRYVYQLTADAAAAEDVVQETYMRLLDTEPEDEKGIEGGLGVFGALQKARWDP